MENKYLCTPMEIIRDIEKTRMVVKCAATIGVFDGVHAGHRQVIKHLVSGAQFHHLASMVITFDRQPRQLFDPEFRPQLLTTQEEKEQEIERLGVDFLVVLPFTKEMASLSAREFMAQILKEKLNVRSLQIGYDNRFGHDRTEGFDDYRRYGQELGINVYQGIKLSFQDYDFAVCSSNIRSLLAEDGDIETATVMLGHPYQLSGKVMPGEHIGHQLGFPTGQRSVCSVGSSRGSDHPWPLPLELCSLATRGTQELRRGTARDDEHRHTAHLRWQEPHLRGEHLRLRRRSLRTDSDHHVCSKTARGTEI